MLSSFVSGVVDRKDGNERIDGFGKWSTYIFTLRMAGDMRPYSFLWKARSTLSGMRVVTSSSNRITLSRDCDDMISTIVTIAHDRLLLDPTLTFMIVLDHISLINVIS